MKNSLVPEYKFYCEKCGEKVVLIWTKPMSKFDIQTGFQHVKYRFECPNFRRGIFFSNGHDSLENDTTPKEY